MKTLLIAMSMFLAMSFTKPAQAQITGTDVIAAAGNLVNVQVGNIDINAVHVIDVTNVLNNNDVNILRDILNDLTIDNVLNNLFRDANIITGNQVVVGVLSDMTTFYVVDKRIFRTKKK